MRLEDRLVGLTSLFARHPLTEAILQEMASVANGIALCIERKRSEEALGASEVKYRSVVEMTPQDQAQRRDPQLQRAVEEALRLLAERPQRVPDLATRPSRALPKLPRRPDAAESTTND